MNRVQLIRAVKQASRKLAEEWPMGSQAEREMIEEWRRIRPKMVKRLESMKILEEFAHLIDYRRWEAQEQYQAAGMPWPDSKEQANLDWLIWEEEDPPGMPKEIDDVDWLEENRRLAERNPEESMLMPTIESLRKIQDCWRVDWRSRH